MQPQPLGLITLNRTLLLLDRAGMISAKGTSQGKSLHFQGFSNLGSRMAASVKEGTKVKFDP